MLNSEFSNARAAALARRLMREHPGDVDAQVRRAIELSTNRPAIREEVTEARDFMELLEREEDFEGERALETFCLIALNLNEFMHVD